MSKEGPVDAIVHMIRGVMMGAADAVPGVSGGTVALVVGVYPRLIAAVSGVDARLFGALRSRDWTAVSKRLDLSLTLPLAIGIGIGIATLAGVMEQLLDDHRAETYATFFGLIVGSVAIVGAMIGKWNAWTFVVALAGAIFTWLLLGQTDAGILPFNEADVGRRGFLFIAGLIAISAMILPGISGSYLLLILGCYETVLRLVKKTLTFDATWGELSELLTFAVGCFIGLLLFSKIVRVLLERFRRLTLAALAGFMVGSLRLLWPFQDFESQNNPLESQTNTLEWPATLGEAATPAALALAGLVVVLALQRLGRKIGGGEAE